VRAGPYTRLRDREGETVLEARVAPPSAFILRASFAQRYSFQGYSFKLNLQARLER
jgi:hypothetical protein